MKTLNHLDEMPNKFLRSIADKKSIPLTCRYCLKGLKECICDLPWKNHKDECAGCAKCEPDDEITDDGYVWPLK